MEERNEKIKKCAEMMEITLEEAEKFLIDNGMLAPLGGGTDKSWAFVMDGVPELVLESGMQSSWSAKFNVASKKAKKKEKFEAGEFYLGRNIVIDKDPDTNDKTVNIEDTTLGYELGDTCRIVILGKKMYQERAITLDKSGNKLNTAISTNFVNSMRKTDQELLFDKNTGKKMSDLKKEIEEEFGELQTNDKGDEYVSLPKEQKIKWKNYYYGIVETEDGWKPFWMKRGIDNTFYGQEQSIQKVLEKDLYKARLEPSSCIITLTANLDDQYWKIEAEHTGSVSDEGIDTMPYIMEFAKKMKDLLQAQQDYLDDVRSNKKEDSKSSVESEIYEDCEVEDELFQDEITEEEIDF